MSPDQIKRLVEVEYPDLVPEVRSNPDGWAFFYRIVRKGPASTRIARAVQGHPSMPCMFKPSISARLQSNRALEVVIDGGPRQVCELLDRELDLWRRHFERQGC